MEVQVLVSEEPAITGSLHTLKCWCFSVYDLVFVQFTLEGKVLITYVTGQCFLVMIIHMSGKLEVAHQTTCYRFHTSLVHVVVCDGHSVLEQNPSQHCTICTHISYF